MQLKNFICLSSVLIVLIALSSGVSAEANQATLTEFAKWLQQYKVYSKANIGIFEGQGLGAVAREEVHAGEPLVIIPSQLLIKNSVIKGEVFKGFNEFNNFITFEPLMAWLLLEKGNEKSPFKAYLDILPETFPEHITVWSEAELDQLQGTGLKESTLGALEILKQAHASLNEKLFKPHIPTFDLTYEKYLWAYQICITRTWTVNINNQTEQVLVPLADMFNHEPQAGVGDISADGNYFSFNATREYKAGEQLFDSYGPKSNYELMFNYGFAIENNPDDSMILHYSLKPSNLVHSIVEPLLKAVDPHYREIRIAPNRAPLALLRVFRLSVMTFSELEHVGVALQGRPVSLTNELKAFRAAIKALTGLYRSYPTTIDEDNQILAQTDISSKLRYAVITRKGQKEILRNVILVLGKMWENVLLEGTLHTGVEIQ